MRPYNGHGWAEDDDDEPVFLSVNGGAPMQLTYPKYTIAHVNDCTQRARQRLCYPNTNSKPYGYKHGDKTGDNASKQPHKHKAMSAAASQTSKKRRSHKKKSSQQSSSSSSDDEPGEEVQYAFLAGVQVYAEELTTTDAHEGEVFDLYARKSKTADKQVDIPLEKTEGQLLLPSEMTAEELQKYIDQLQQSLTPLVSDMAESSA
jgi:hypothetical protein